MLHYLLRSLMHYWRTHLFILFGLAVATAVIVGSLVVGDSMAGSLRDNALEHLGKIDHVMMSPHVFSASLAEDLRRGRDMPAFSVVSPAIMLRGSAAPPEGDLRIPNVTVVGIDVDFYSLFPLPESSGAVTRRLNPVAVGPGACAINRAVADDLHLRVGDDLLLTLDRPSALSDNLIFAHRRRDETLRTLRLTIKEIVPEPMGGFALGPQATVPRNVFVSREALAVALEQPQCANVLLASSPGRADPSFLQKSLASHVRLADHGLSLVTSELGQCVMLESASLLLTAAQVAAAKAAAEELHASAGPVSVYLATRIAKAGPEGRSIAYAMVAGLGDPLPAWSMKDGAVPGATGQIALNSWAGKDLGAGPGDKLELTFLLPTAEGTYHDATMPFTVSGIIDLSGVAMDPHLTPTLRGMTDAKHMDQWNLPFPMDSKRLTVRDDEYWDRYSTTPKAFVSMADMQSIWAAVTPANASSKAGPFVTSLRLVPAAGTSLEQFQKDYSAALQRHLTPEQSGLIFRPIRQQVTAASAGSTDFGQLFLALSFFLILAASALSGMFMRLLLEQRSAEIGLLLAAGFSPGRVGRLMLAEGWLLVLLATLVGVPAGVLYNQLIIHAMNDWWTGPWQAAHLSTHLLAPSIAMGAVSGVLLGLGCILWALWSLRQLPVLRLLSGRQALGVLAVGRRRAWPFVLPAVLGMAAVGFLAAALRRAVSPEMAFFSAGGLLLVAALCFLWIGFRWILQSAAPTISLFRLAIRNAAANRARSVLVVGLLASATFIIVAVAANHRDYSTLDPSDRASATGGFALRGITSAPLHMDLSSPAGRSRLGLPASAETAFSRATIITLAQSPGEDISCLNLATPLHPRLVGVTPALTNLHPFAVTTAGPAPANPWELLDGAETDGAIPAFGDADSLEWTLHTSLGQILTFAGPSGQPVKLRIVGSIPGSIFAGELLISDAHVHALYPDLSGSTYFLVAASRQDQPVLADALRSGLSDFGLELRSTPEILNAFVSIQNIYLSIFMSLGALGLLLGSAGMIAVIARNVLERRSELALLSAAGFARGRLVYLLVLENGSLLLLGLAIGAGSALLAVAPAIGSAQNTVAWGSLAGILAGVSALGLACCIITARLSIGPSPINALREE